MQDQTIPSKITFLGILENTDSSICDLKLDKGFKFVKSGDKEFYELFMNRLEPLGNIQYSSGIFSFFNNTEKSFYLVTNAFEENINQSEIISKMDTRKSLGLNTCQYMSSVWAGRFGNKLDLRYLHNTIRLMNLFKEGNIGIPLSYYFTIFENECVLFERGGGFPTFPIINNNALFSLDDTEKNELSIFLSENNDILFSNYPIGIAFSNFEQSVKTDNIDLAFLSLMICIEVIYSPKTELRNRVSRGVAILLGRDRDESIGIYKIMKDLYDKRSSLVHSGKSISENDLLVLRDYARESIKRLLRIDNNKLLEKLDRFREEINMCGFGDNPLFRS